ncbi:MAG: cytochrome c biogenesis protein CcdA [Candidatus Omnitrophota bacterium]
MSEGSVTRRQFWYFTAIFLVIMNNTALAAGVSYLNITAKEVQAQTRQLQEGIQTTLGSSTIKELDYQSKEAEEWINRLHITFLPYVIFDQSIEKNDQFFHLVRQGALERKNGRYVIPDEALKQTGVMLLKRTRKPGRLDVFVMSQCPGARPVVTQLANYIKAKPDKVKLTLHYLTTFQEFGIDSLHGPEEIKEDLRQIILQRYYPREFISYLLLINEKPPAEALGELGISLKYLDSKRKEALDILRRDFNLARELEIKQSPTILWENIYLMPDIEGLKYYPPFKKEEYASAPAPGVPAKIPVEFFFSYGCRGCLWVKDTFLPELEDEYKDKIIVTGHDISTPGELALKLSMEREYGILGGSVPLIFLPGNIALEGKNEISRGLKTALQGLSGRAIPAETNKIVSKEKTITGNFFGFSPAVISLAGLLDGLNPCAFATMVFFVSFLTINSFRKRQIIYIGGAFITGVFLTYLGLGLGIFEVFKKMQIYVWLSRLVYYGIAGLTLSLGIYSMYDYLRYRKTGVAKACSLNMYNRLRRLGDNNRGTFILAIAAFLNGLLIALLESACTGQVYFPTIAFVMRMPHLRLHAASYLLLYNVLFIIPLIIIFTLAYKGTGSERVILFTTKHQGPVKLASALLFFSLAAFLFLFS